MSAQVGYIRVSTLDQNTERQLVDIHLDKVFEDKASGKDTKRPQLEACLSYLREGDTLIVHSIDRLARNLEDLQRIIRELNAKSVSIRFLKENLDFMSDGTTPMQTLMLQMLGAFAQFERALIKERQREGIALAKRNGKAMGRPKALTCKQKEELKKLIIQGKSKQTIAKEFGISRPTLYRALKDV